MRSKAPKNTLWAFDGCYYGRVTSYPEPQDFLAAIYRGEGQIDEDHQFYEDWKERNPLEVFIEREERQVRRSWYRYSFMDGGGLYLDDAKPHTRGAFEIWEWLQ